MSPLSTILGGACNSTNRIGESQLLYGRSNTTSGGGADYSTILKVSVILKLRYNLHLNYLHELYMQHNL